MPANITLGKSDFTALMRELRNVDKQLINEMRRSFRGDLKPVNEAVRAKIPTTPPLSGFTKNVGVSPYVYGRPTASVKVNTRHKGGRQMARVVSTIFSDRKPNAGFTILERAGSRSQGNTPQGRGMIRALNAAAPMRGGLGRFAIPEFKRRGPEIEAIVRKILVRFADKVNLKMRTKN